MPTIITHAAVGIASGLAISKGKPAKRFWVLSILCAILPDFDVVAFKLGILYNSFWGHRGFYHSLFFAMITGVFIASVFFRKDGFFSKSWLFYTTYFSVVTATHGILDAFTDGGLGIALLTPFDNERYFFWTTPIAVSPLSIKAFLSERGISILKNEFLWVWAPAIFIVAIGRLNYVHNKQK